jgi:hypothetical protein
MFLLNLVLMTRSMSLIIQGTDVGLVRCLLYKKLKIINKKKSSSYKTPDLGSDTKSDEHQSIINELRVSLEII